MRFCKGRPPGGYTTKAKAEGRRERTRGGKSISLSLLTFITFVLFLLLVMVMMGLVVMMMMMDSGANGVCVVCR